MTEEKPNRVVSVPVLAKSGEQEHLATFTRGFLEHATRAPSQYDGTCRRMAAHILAAEDAIDVREQELFDLRASLTADQAELEKANAMCRELGKENLRLAEESHEHQGHANQLQQDLEAEQSGRLELRKRLGALEHETFGMFVTRLHDRATTAEAALKAAETELGALDAWLDSEAKRIFRPLTGGGATAKERLVVAIAFLEKQLDGEIAEHQRHHDAEAQLTEKLQAAERELRERSTCSLCHRDAATSYCRKCNERLVNGDDAVRRKASQQPATPQPPLQAQCAYLPCQNTPLPGSRRCYDHQPQRCSPPQPAAADSSEGGGGDWVPKVGDRVRHRTRGLGTIRDTPSKLLPNSLSNADVAFDVGPVVEVWLSNLEPAPPAEPPQPKPHGVDLKTFLVAEALREEERADVDQGAWDEGDLLLDAYDNARDERYKLALEYLVRWCRRHEKANQSRPTVAEEVARLSRIALADRNRAGDSYHMLLHLAEAAEREAAK